MTETIAWRKDFDNRTMVYCMSQYPGFAALEEKQKLPKLRELQAQWMNDFGTKDRAQEPEAASMSFSRWLVEFHVPNMGRNAVNVQSYREIDFGGVKQGYSITRSFVLTDKMWLNTARQVVDSELNRMFEHFERLILPTLSAGQAGQARGGAIQEVTIDVKKVIRELRDGKRYVKVFGGDWMKHGVNLYEEVMAQHDFNWKGIPDEGFEPAMWKAVVQVKDGHPRKVLSLIGV